MPSPRVHSQVDVVFPCLNEEAALPGLLSSLPVGYRAIVVDNGSTDDSARVAEGLGALVVSEPRRGFGSAAHAGLLAATAPIVAFCDADGSFDPLELPRVVAPILDGSADLMLGRRRPVSSSAFATLAFTSSAWPLHARVANRVLARRLRSLTGAVIHDLGPMRAAKRTGLLALELRDRRSGYPLEMVLRAAAHRWRIGETDVTYRPRIGVSKVTGTVRGTVTAVADMSRLLRAATR